MEGEKVEQAALGTVVQYVVAPAEEGLVKALKKRDKPLQSTEQCYGRHGTWRARYDLVAIERRAGKLF